MYIIDTNKDSNLIVELTQNDNNTGNIEFQILKNGKPLNLTGKKVKLALVKNTTNKGDIITNVNVTNPTNGIVSIPITTLITRKKGLFVCGLAVYNVDYLENTGNFRINIKRDIFEDTAEVIIGDSVYSELLKMLETSDKTITEFKQKINNSIDDFNSAKVETLKNFKNEKDKVITEFKAEGKTEADNRKKEWDSLKKIAIEENNAVELQSQINVLDKALKSNQSLEYKGENITCNDTLSARTENLQILGNTKYKRKDNSLTDVWEEGVSLESTGEVEKNLIEIKSCGKNLVYKKMLNTFIDVGGQKFEVLETEGVISYVAKVQPLKTYSYTGNGLSRNVIGTTNKKPATGEKVLRIIHSKNQITTTKDENYIVWYVGKTTDNIKNIQIEENPTPTPYEPYQGDTKQIQLPHPLRKVGDVADRIFEKDGKVWLEQNIGLMKIQEELTKGRLEGYEEGRFAIYEVNDARHGENTCITDTLPINYGYTTPGLAGFNGWEDVNSAHFVGRVPNNETPSEWFAKNPTTVLYQLEIPIVTELNIKNIDLDTFNSITHITSDNNIQPTLDFKVPSNLASIVQSNSRAINEIYDLIDTLITPQLIQNRLDIDINKI